MAKYQMNIYFSNSESLALVKRGYKHFIKRIGRRKKSGKCRFFYEWCVDALITKARQELKLQENQNGQKY